MLGVVRVPEVAFPRPPDSELVETQHVHYTHLGDGGSEELGVLGEAGTNEEPAVGGAVYGYLFRSRPPRRGEPSGTVTKIVEDPLLMSQTASVVPRAPVFASASEHGYGQ